MEFVGTFAEGKRMNRSSPAASRLKPAVKGSGCSKEKILTDGVRRAHGKSIDSVYTKAYKAAGLLGIFGLLLAGASMLRRILENKVWYLSWNQNEVLSNTSWPALLKAAGSLDPRFSFWDFIAESFGLLSLLFLSASLLVCGIGFLN